MDIFEASEYSYIILASAIIILSFLYNAFSERTNIPSVLMLIGTGILLHVGMDYLGLPEVELMEVLKIVGVIGLIMIVLEAALDLELTRDKLPIIWKSLTVAFLGLLVSTTAAAAILSYVIADLKPVEAMLYATPLSILSSAIIIPSVGNLSQTKKEFHIYESTFSDILGIMQFYFILGLAESTGNGSAEVGSFFGGLVLTIGVSLLASYLLILLFQNIKSHTKLFLLIAILILLYSIGKLMHLSSLIMILIFGLVLSNSHLFFRGRLAKWLKKEEIHRIEGDFHVVTAESAFVIRTLFFVIFGMTISLASLLNLQVVGISLAILVSIYLVRWLLFRIFERSGDIIPQLYIAPRGLITVLLYFSIPETMALPEADGEIFSGIMLFVIIATSLIMAFALIAEGNRKRNTEGDDLQEALVIPPEKIYEGFQSDLVEEKYPSQS
ncbi:MAG: cation:proton antiporter [Bacteroidota bacterium]